MWEVESAHNRATYIATYVAELVFILSLSKGHHWIITIRIQSQYNLRTCRDFHVGPTNIILSANLLSMSMQLQLCRSSAAGDLHGPSSERMISTGCRSKLSCMCSWGNQVMQVAIDLTLLPSVCVRSSDKLLNE